MAGEMNTVFYRSDRGDVYEVSKMETSHLINVIGHHLNQIATLNALGFIDRQLILRRVIEVLSAELATREPSMNEYLLEKP